MWELVKHRNFGVLWAGQVVSVFGNNLFTIALPWFVYYTTHSKEDLVLTGLSLTLPGVGGVFAGVFVDRWSKRRTMIIVDIARCTLLVVLSVIVHYAWSLDILLSLLFLFRLVGSLFSPAESSLIPLVVDAEELPNASALNQSGRSIAQVLGSASGGTLLIWFGAWWLFLADAASFALSSASLWAVQIVEPVPKALERHFWMELRSGWVIIRNSPQLLRVLLVAVLANGTFAPLDIILTAWVRDRLHATSFWFGALNGGFFIGMILGGLCLPICRRQLSLMRIAQIGLLVMGGALGGMVAWPNPYWDSGMMIIFGAANGVMASALTTWLWQSVPANVRGRVFGTLSAGVNVSAALGMVVVGVLMTDVTLPILLVLVALLAWAETGILLLPIRRPGFHDRSQSDVLS